MQDAQHDLLSILKAYCARYPAEANRHTSPAESGFLALQAFVERSSDAALFSRKNFQGHLTASAFILNAKADHVLLLHHKSLNKWLQPGGHIDASDKSILAAAYREVEEETGIERNQLQLISEDDSTTIPFDIDSHVIPANPRKSEAAHVHHDFRFLLQLKEEVSITISALESTAYRWMSVHSLHEIEDHARVSEKMLALAF